MDWEKARKGIEEEEDEEEDIRKMESEKMEKQEKACGHQKRAGRPSGVGPATFCRARGRSQPCRPGDSRCSTRLSAGGTTSTIYRSGLRRGSYRSFSLEIIIFHLVPPHAHVVCLLSTLHRYSSPEITVCIPLLEYLALPPSLPPQADAKRGQGKPAKTLHPLGCSSGATSPFDPALSLLSRYCLYVCTYLTYLPYPSDQSP
jgi:hypothetical protein